MLEGCATEGVRRCDRGDAGFREARLSETRLPRITALGNSVNRARPGACPVCHPGRAQQFYPTKLQSSPLGPGLGVFPRTGFGGNSSRCIKSSPDLETYEIR